MGEVITMKKADSNLDKIGKELKVNIKAGLVELDAWNDGDEVVLDQLCSYHQDFRWAVSEIESKGRLQEFANGTKNVSPEWSVKTKSSDMILKYAKELGLSPAVRKALVAGDIVEAPEKKREPTRLEKLMDNKKKKGVG